MTCPLCNDTGEQRYWEGRWRDEKAENERLLAALKTADTAIARYCSHQVGYQDAYVAFKDARTEIKAALGNQQGTQEPK